MVDSKEYRLSGGIFFSLLLQARKQRTAVRGNADGRSDSDIFEGLIKVAFPNFCVPNGGSFKTYTSQYKACKLSTNEYLPFDNSELVDRFDNTVKMEYSVALERMSEFIGKFIDDVDMGHWLVRALFEIIEYDTSIEDELFYIENGSQPYDKNHLLQVNEVELPSFLLGIWHFIIWNRSDNTVGADTFDILHKKPDVARAKHAFISDIGKNRYKQVDISLASSVQEAPEENESADRKTGHVMEIPEGMLAVVSSDGVAPEVTGDPSTFFLIEKTALGIETGEYAEYLENTRDKYGKMKTLLYSDAPRKFEDFYVCNNIQQKIYIKRYTYRTKIISDATASVLKECSNFILITGTGGLGKSMMMRHLLLDAIDDYKEGGQIPVFIPLKDYSDSYTDLFDYVYEKFDGLDGNHDDYEFEALLSEGKCLLLFDGLDEIKSDYRKKFERDLENFADKFTDNMFVISSRPTGAFVSFHRFTILDLCPFNKVQALSLIEKLDFRTDEPGIKEHFRKELETRLFITHREFTENPLLLTIMLMTYEQFADIPSKMHIFYKEAYVALSQKHDASKGAFKRTLRTGLTADQFADYFAEFCARTYRDEKFEFSETQFDKYFNEMHELARGSQNITAADFRTDLTDNMCLMYYESGKYHFTHRSFQEYFCALYFSKQKDKNLGAIGNLFENKRRRFDSDKTFSMLYDMIPDKIDEYVFEPFLENLFQECDQKKEYWTFLEKMYPILYYDRGEAGNESVNQPESFLYNFIIQKEGIAGYLDNEDLPEDEDFLTDEWVYLEEGYNDPDIDTDALIEISEIPHEYKLRYGTPDVVGRNYEIDVEKVFASPEYYRGIVDILEDEWFPLRIEYEEAREYLETLKKRKAIPGDDLFDLF
jgi:hypothetical protein